MKSENWSGISKNQGTPEVAGESPGARKRQGRIFLQISEHGTANTMISDV